MVCQAELRTGQQSLRRRQRHSGKVAIPCVLVSQIAADGRRVAAAKVELQQGRRQPPACQRRVGDAGPVERRQAVEVELRDLPAVQAIGRRHVVVGAAFDDNLQVRDAVAVGAGIPILEGQLLLGSGFQHQIVAALREQQVGVDDPIGQRHGVVLARARKNRVPPPAAVERDDVGTPTRVDEVVAGAALERVIVGAARQQVRAAVSRQPVVERIAHAAGRARREVQVLDMLVQGVVDRGIHGVHAFVGFFQHDIGRMVDEIDVVAGPACHGVGALRAIERVGAGFARQLVDERVAAGVNRVRADQRQIHDVVAERVGDRGQHGVVARSALACLAMGITPFNGAAFADTVADALVDAAIAAVAGGTG